MLALLVLIFLLLFGLITALLGVIWFLYAEIQRYQRTNSEFISTLSQQSLDQARDLASRAPADLKKLMETVDKSVKMQVEALMEGVKTAWNPSPTPSQNPGGVEPYKYPFPTPFYADESNNNDTSDPTDAYLGGGVRPDAAMINEDALEGGHPFGIPGLDVIDPLMNVPQKVGRSGGAK